MIKRKIVIMGFFAFCLTATLFVGVTGLLPYDPWCDINDDGIIDIVDLSHESLRLWAEGNPTRNVTVTNFPEQTSREMAIYASPETYAGDGASWWKLGEFVVPSDKKWCIYKISLKNHGEWVDKMTIKLVLRDMPMMEVGANTLPYDVIGGKNFYTTELKKPIELFADEKFELWTLNEGGYDNYCGILIEAWVEEV